MLKFDIGNLLFTPSVKSPTHSSSEDHHITRFLAPFMSDMTNSDFVMGKPHRPDH